MADTKTCRVITITKDEMKWCGSRSITAELIDAESKVHNINWVRTPSVYSSRNSKMLTSKKPEAFEEAWDSIKEGDTVTLFLDEEYFVPCKE